jgi:hypothetical protein
MLGFKTESVVQISKDLQNWILANDGKFRRSAKQDLGKSDSMNHISNEASTQALGVLLGVSAEVNLVITL